MRMPETVLVVDDDATTRDVIVRYLEREGFEALEAEDGGRARAVIESAEPNLVILDLMLPGIDGLEVMRRLRRGTGPAPAIILLTARGEESDRITGLRLGADDYVVKPFSPGELVARVDAVLRRAPAAEAEHEVLRAGDVVIDVGGRRVTRGGEEVALTVREFELLAFLARHPGQAFTREELMERVWRFSFYTDTSTVTVHVRRLRSKLEPDPDAPRLIETVWGVGYRFASQS
jgi:two-component system, OmpR family, response regulator ResD